MGILRTREELLPVTCAVMSAEDRNAFFSLLKKKCGGRVEKIATAGETTKAVVAEWMSGKTNVPYNTLQRLSGDFNIDLPKVSELRREYQPVVEIRLAKSAPKKSSPPEASKARKETPPQPERRPKDENSSRAPAKKQERRPKTRKKKADTQEAKQEHRPNTKASTPGMPKLSDKAAYWAGATLAAATREGDSLVFKIKDEVGQNFTRVWAKYSEELFGVKAKLEDLKQATLPANDLKEFIDRLELKENQPPPGAPRWAWSNPNWKLAFLRGVIDASTAFRRDPALEIMGLSERLAVSIKKLLNSQKFEITPGEGTILLEGREQVKRYFLSIGTENLKLNDQFKAFFKGDPETAPIEENKSPSAAKKKGRRRGGKDRGRGRGQGRRNPRTETSGESAAAEFAGSENTEE